MPKVSVIIPVCNVERYIERCARSLFQQSLDDIEFIFVDDCYPDKSIFIVKKVLEEFPNRESQTHFIRMPQNSGTGAVRRRGQEVATGDYIIHCDSDDWVDTDYYRELYTVAQKTNADIVVSDFKREYASKSVTINCSPSSNPKDSIKRMPQESFYCMLWNKLIRRQILSKYNITTSPGIDMWEDVAVTLKSFYYANRVSKASGVYYHYRINPNSYTVNSGNEKSYRQRCLCISELTDFFYAKEEDWTVLLDYWKMLAKSFLLCPGNFNPSRWKKEYPEAIRNLTEMTSFSKRDQHMMSLANESPLIATIYAIPSILKYNIKRLIK